MNHRRLNKKGINMESNKEKNLDDEEFDDEEELEDDEE